MKNLRVLLAVMGTGLVGLVIWVVGTSPKQAGATAGNDTAGIAYDYAASDVTVQQMGPDGNLQYELQAKKITQLPRNGQISAHDLVMYRDPAGSPPGGAHRWTLTADRADLPDSGAMIVLQGAVQAQGRPENSAATVAVATEQLTYNMETQDVSSNQPIEITWGGSRFRSGDLRFNIKSGALAVDSKINGTLAPR